MVIGGIGAIIVWIENNNMDMYGMEFPDGMLFLWFSII
jgi:hypothetical protein